MNPVSRILMFDVNGWEYQMTTYKGGDDVLSMYKGVEVFTTMFGRLDYAHYLKIAKAKTKKTPGSKYVVHLLTVELVE